MGAWVSEWARLSSSGYVVVSMLPDYNRTFFLKHVTRERAASRLQERVDATGRKPVGGDGVAEVVGLETQTWYSPGQIVSAT